MQHTYAPPVLAESPAVDISGESPDDRADRLAAVAVEMVTRVREFPAEANWRWLIATLPHPLDREALAFVLAAAVPVDQPWRHLTAWAEFAREAA